MASAFPDELARGVAVVAYDRRWPGARFMFLLGESDGEGFFSPPGTVG